MKIHKNFFSQVLHWNTAFPIRRPGSQMSTANFDYPHHTKRRLLTSASPLISAAPYMWRLLEIVPYTYTSYAYTNMDIEQVYISGAL